MLNAIHHIILGELPSRQQLENLNREGAHYLVNVSGIDLFGLYSQQDLSPFSISQFIFKDVFSDQPMPLTETSLEQIQADVYVHLTTALERETFRLAALKVVECLRRQESFFLFCHQGIGRSPCVLFAALAYSYQEDYPNILKKVNFLNPKSVMTTVSYSAVNWFLSHADL